MIAPGTGTWRPLQVLRIVDGAGLCHDQARAGQGQARCTWEVSSGGTSTRSMAEARGARSSAIEIESGARRLHLDVSPPSTGGKGPGSARFVARWTGAFPTPADDVAGIRWVTRDELDGLDFAWAHADRNYYERHSTMDEKDLARTLGFPARCSASPLRGAQEVRSPLDGRIVEMASFPHMAIRAWACGTSGWGWGFSLRSRTTGMSAGGSRSGPWRTRVTLCPRCSRSRSSGRGAGTRSWRARDRVGAAQDAAGRSARRLGELVGLQPP